MVSPGDQELEKITDSMINFQRANYQQSFWLIGSLLIGSLNQRLSPMPVLQGGIKNSDLL
jgi:hypothetical protein